MTAPSPDDPTAATRVAATRKGVHDRLDSIGPVAPVEFRSRRTLGLRVEAVRQLRRRRTQVAALLVLAIAGNGIWETVEHLSLPPEPGNGIIISRTNFGGFKAKIGARRPVLVKRVR